MTPNPDHSDNIVALRRIEDQIRGIERMMEENKYCIDILNQILAVQGALRKTEEKILTKHLENCVADTVMGNSETDRKKKFEEIMNLLHLLRK